MTSATAFPEIRVSVRSFDGDIVVARRDGVLDIGFSIPLGGPVVGLQSTEVVDRRRDVARQRKPAEKVPSTFVAALNRAEAELDAKAPPASTVVETGDSGPAEVSEVATGAEVVAAVSSFIGGDVSTVAEVRAENAELPNAPGRATDLDDEAVFADGYRVGKVGGVRYNPHPEGSHERSVWDRGWDKGTLDFERERAGAGQPGEENLDSYKEGVEAGRSGADSYTNPYSSMGRDHGAWERGRLAGVGEAAGHATAEGGTESAEAGAKEADGFVVLSATGMLGRYKKAGEPMKKVLIGHLGDILTVADVNAFAERNRVAIDALADDKREEVLAAIEARRAALAEPSVETGEASDGQPVDIGDATATANAEPSDEHVDEFDRPVIIRREAFGSIIADNGFSTRPATEREIAEFESAEAAKSGNVTDNVTSEPAPESATTGAVEDVPLPLGDQPAAQTTATKPKARSLKVEPIKLAGGDIDWAATYAALRKSLTVIDDVDDLERWVKDNLDLNGELKANVPTWYQALEGFYGECRNKMVVEADASGQAA